MRYLSVCSGIEAASVAWKPLGWSAVAFSEIEPFPCSVLAHHYPNVPNWGDMTKFKEWPDATVDVLVGGTPCQSFSVAGLRKGLDDPRGNLMLTYLAIAAKYRPEWMVWENVPGVLSSNGGRDFGALLGGLAELGYGFAYRVLDAQHFGLAQRRKRVFVVANSRDWRRAAAVLFNRESLSGNPPPSRETRQDTTGRTGDGIARCLTTGEAKRQDGTANAMTTPNGGRGGIGVGAIAHAFDARQSNVIQYGDISGPLDTAEHSIAIAFSCKDHGADAGDVSPTLRSMNHDGSHANGGGQVAVAIRTANTGANGHGISKEVAHTLDLANGQAVAFAQNQRDEVREMDVAGAYRVRRLTPTEGARLQGFQDDYLDITFRGKPAADGNKYRALGNSMAVPCMSWLGKRIAAVSKIVRKAERVAA